MEEVIDLSKANDASMYCGEVSKHLLQVSLRAVCAGMQCGHTVCAGMQCGTAGTLTSWCVWAVCVGGVVQLYRRFNRTGGSLCALAGVGEYKLTRNVR